MEIGVMEDGRPTFDFGEVKEESSGGLHRLHGNRKYKTIN